MGLCPQVLGEGAVGPAAAREKQVGLLGSPVYRKSDDLVMREIADEIILVPVKGALASLRQFFVLNSVSAFIWERLDGATNLEAIQASVIEYFDVSPGQARADVEELMHDFAEAGMVSRIEESLPTNDAVS